MISFSPSLFPPLILFLLSPCLLRFSVQGDFVDKMAGAPSLILWVSKEGGLEEGRKGGREGGMRGWI